MEQKTSILPEGLNSWNIWTEVTEYIKFRNTNPIPDVMTILSGIGSPQEMVHTDEKWHTENFMWGNARTRRRDFWSEENEDNWTSTQLKR